jgi:hypothetical protein
VRPPSLPNAGGNHRSIGPNRAIARWGVQFRVVPVL